MTFGTPASLAARVGGRVLGDENLPILRIGAVDDADANTLTFAVDERYLRNALASKAGAVLTDERFAPSDVPGKPLILVPAVREALATLLAAFAPPRPVGPSRHPSAVIDPTAELAHDVVVGPFVVVGARARVGTGVVLGAGAIVGEDATIGAGSTLHPHAQLLDRCTIGARCVLHNGAVVGGEGFGWVVVDGTFRKIPQIGNVELADDVEIGVNTCVDRAQTGTTSIGQGSKIDNLCQIGHNCRIGKHSAFAAQNGLAGTTVIGDYVQSGGQAGFKGHLTVGSRVGIIGRSEVWGDIADDSVISGSPARNHRDVLKEKALIRKLPKLIARIDALEDRSSEGRV
jgi:UDP-3-O-[3-hydroxymyristoyl] glucosamine N-acyltransferase